MQFGIERSGNCSGNNVNRNEKSGLLAIKKAGKPAFVLKMLDLVIQQTQYLTLLLIGLRLVT